jgi:hypothetical protein
MIQLEYIIIILCLLCSVAVAQNTDTVNTVDRISKVEQSKSNSFDTLVGPLPKLLRNQGRPYLVTADIEVPADQTVSIEPGVVLLFRDFSGLHVQGKLIALGTRVSPIVLTSEFDTLYNKSSGNIPNPFDWNGVYIHSGGIGTSMEYCKIFYSVYGIKSDTKYIRIAPGLFKDNGKSSLTIDGKFMDTGEKPFTYELNMKDAATDGVPINILRDPLAPRRNIVRYVGLCALLGGLGSGGYFGWQAWKQEQDLKPLSSDASDNTRKNSNMAWTNVHDQRNKYITYSAISGAAVLLGLTGFVWTFTF